MYYRAAKNRSYINSQVDRWLKGGVISPEMGRGLKASVYMGDLERGDDLIRGFNNFTEFSDETEEADEAGYTQNAESPVSDGRGGYVPNGGAAMHPEGERSRLDAISYDGVYNRDVKLMHELYGRINAFLYPIAVETVNEAEYPGSTVYDYDLPEREGSQGGTIRDFEITRDRLNQMIDKVYEKAVMMSDDIDEIMNDDNEMTAGNTREELLRAAIESLLLTELFISRRPFYRQTAEVYRFFDGRYDGMNPSY
ncbi:MAG: hypothetical protein LUG24_03000 [Clostridiales bacterium]|nr:hypothetical protein [Clostridiales bacterium]